MHRATLGVLAATLLLGAAATSTPAQPPRPPAPPAAALERLPPGFQERVLGALAAYPDEVVALVLEAAQHPQYLVELKPHPTDAGFNAAASTLYTEYPELFAALQQNPLTTAIVGATARRDPAATWSAIDQQRTAARSAPVAVDTSSLEASIGQGTAAINSSTQQLAEVNQSLTSINNQLDQANETATDVKHEYYDAKAKAGETRSDAQSAADKAREAAPAAAVAGTVSASGRGGASAANPFGTAGFAGASKLSREGAGGDPSKAWSAKSLSPQQMSAMKSGNGQKFGAAFGQSEKQLGSQRGQQPTAGATGAPRGGRGGGPSGARSGGGGRPSRP